MNYGNFTLIGLGNFDNKERTINEVDLTVDFTKAVKSMVLSGGYTLCLPQITGEEKSHEVYAGVGLDNLLNPKFTIFHSGEGTYVKSSIGHEFVVGKIQLSTEMGLGRHLNAGLSHLESSLSAPIDLGKGVFLVPQFGSSTPLGSRSREDFKNGMYGGVGMEVKF